MKYQLPLLLLLAGCPTPSTVVPKDGSCSTAADCQGGLLCIDGTCKSPADIKGIGPADPARTSLTFDRNDVPADGVEEAKLKVALLDADGLVPASTAVTLTIDGTDVEADQLTAVSDAQGVVTFNLHAKAVTEKTLSVSWMIASGVVTKTADTPLRFVQALADAAKSTLSFTKTSAILADGLDFTEASIKLVTAAGGVPYGASVALESDQAGIFVTGSAAVDQKGETKLQLRSRLSGVKLIRAVSSNVTLSTTPSVSFQVAPIIANATSVIAESNKTTAIADAEDYIDLSILVPTTSGGASREFPITLNVCTLPATTCEDITTAEEPLSLHVRVRSTIAATKPLILTVQAGVIDIAIDNLIFVPGPPDASHSYFTIDTDRTSIGVPAILELKSADKFDNPRPNDSVSFSSTPAFVGLPTSPATTDGAGLFTAPVSCGVPVVSTITASFSGGLALSLPFRALAAWAERESPFNASSYQHLINPNDLNHVIKWTNNPVEIHESHDAGISFSRIDGGLTGIVNSLAMTASATPRLWVVQANVLRYKDGDGPWTVFSPAAPAPPNIYSGYSVVVAGGTDPSKVFMILNDYCGAGTCESPYTSYRSRDIITRYTPASGWTQHSLLPLFDGHGSHPSWPRQEYGYNYKVDDTDSALLFFDTALSEYLDSSNNTYEGGGVHALPSNASTFVKLDATDPGFVIDGAVERAIVLQTVFERRQVNAAGNGYSSEVAFSAPSNGVISSTLGYSLGASAVAKVCPSGADQALFQRFVPGTGWVPVAGAPVGLKTTACHPAGAPLGADGNVVIANLPYQPAVFKSGERPFFIAYKPDCNGRRAHLKNRRLLCRDSNSVSLHDGVAWHHWYDAVEYPEDVIPGFDEDTYYEIQRGSNSYLTYERKVSSGASIVIPTSQSNNLFVLPANPDYRFATRSSAIWAIKSGGTWTQLFSSSPGTDFAILPNGTIYRPNGGVLQQWNSSAWADVASTGITGSVTSVFADPRVPNTSFVIAGTTVWKRAPAASTWTSFATFTGSTPNYMSFPLDEPAKVRLFKTTGTMAWGETTGSAFAMSTCASNQTDAEQDLFEQRHFIKQKLENWAFCR